MVKFVDLGKQWDEIKDSCLPKIEEFLSEGLYINDLINMEFEHKFNSVYLNSDTKNYVISCSNGQSAIHLALHTLINQEDKNRLIIVPGNTYIASVLPAVHLKFDILCVDCDKHYQMDTEILEAYVQNARKNYDQVIIMPVHLTGHPSNMIAINHIAKTWNCHILEDCSQAHGASVQNNHKVGLLGDIAAFSCQPTKNLGACGEAGIVVTQDYRLNKKVKQLRNRGLKDKNTLTDIGYNMRINSLQSIILLEKLNKVHRWDANRKSNALRYNIELHNLNNIILPPIADYVHTHVFHNYVLRVKNGATSFRAFMHAKGIETAVHYPVTIKDNLAQTNKCIKAEAWKGQLVSIPVHPHLTEEEINKVIEAIKEYAK